MNTVAMMKEALADLDDDLPMYFVELHPDDESNLKRSFENNVCVSMLQVCKVHRIVGSGVQVNPKNTKEYVPVVYITRIL